MKKLRGMDVIPVIKGKAKFTSNPCHRYYFEQMGILETTQVHRFQIKINSQQEGNDPKPNPLKEKEKILQLLQ